MRAKNSRREVQDGPALDRLDSGFIVRALSRPRHALAHCEVDLHAGRIELQGNQIRAAPIRWSTSPTTYRAVAIRHGGSNGSNENPRRIPQVLLSGLARKV